MVSEAFCITYDGLDVEDLPTVLAHLEENSLKATFFVNPPTVLLNPDAWRKVSEAGHEIGNGSLQGVTDNGRLPSWTLKMVEQDLHMTNQFLTDFFGTAPTSFAYSGHKSCVADGADYGFVVNQMFTRVRLLPGDHSRAGIPSLDVSDFSPDYPVVLRISSLRSTEEIERHHTMCAALRGQTVVLFRELPEE